MYKDIEQKLAFHKERIIKEFIKRGVYPDDNMISKKLDEIDVNLSLLQHDQVVSGEEFDTDAYNGIVKLLYKDLEILYGLLYEITVKEYVTLKAYVDTHLDELEDMANMYKLKAQQEANSTSLGTTILFKSSGFDIVNKDNITIVDLGDVQVNKGSRIAFFMDANEIEANKIIFGLQKGNDDPMYVTPYNYNQDSITIPGELEVATYTTSIDANQVINGPVEMQLNGNKADEKNDYTILAGKDKILIKKFADTTSQFIEERPTALNMVSFNARSYIDFYVVGGSKITFRFNKKPINANFSLDDYKVTNLNHIHHFFIECDEGFSFDFELDGGTVYAIKENGVINNDKLYFSRLIDVRDFYVEEYKTGDQETYGAFAKVVNDTGEPIDIQSVAIKQLLTFGGD